MTSFPLPARPQASAVPAWHIEFKKDTAIEGKANGWRGLFDQETKQGYNRHGKFASNHNLMAERILGAGIKSRFVHSLHLTDAPVAILETLDISGRGHTSVGYCDGLPAFNPNIIFLADALASFLTDGTTSPRHIRCLSDMVRDSVAVVYCYFIIHLLVLSG